MLLPHTHSENEDEKTNLCFVQTKDFLRNINSEIQFMIRFMNGQKVYTPLKFAARNENSEKSTVDFNG